MVHDDFLAKIELGNLARLSDIYQGIVPIVAKERMSMDAAGVGPSSNCPMYAS